MFSFIAKSINAAVICVSDYKLDVPGLDPGFYNNDYKILPCDMNRPGKGLFIHKWLKLKYISRFSTCN